VILDNEQNLAFVHIPHCGGSTLKLKLMEQPHRFSVHLPNDVPPEFLANNEIGKDIGSFVEPIDHLPCKYAPEGYKVVTVVKNPFHREVSAYNLYLKFQMLKGKNYFNTFEDYIKFKYLSEPDTDFFQFKTGRMCRDQYWYMHDGDKLATDYTFKLEDMSYIWSKFAPLYKLPLDAWENKVNQQTPKYLDFRRMYTQELVDIVTNSTKDCTFLNYSFE